MATLNAQETLAKSAGSLYLAEFPTEAPDVDDITDRDALEADGWVHAGWLHEDGPGTDGFEGDTTKHYGWNAVAPIRSITRINDPMIPVTLLQWNVENLSLYFAGAEYDEPNKILSIPETGNPAEQALLLIVEDDDKAIAIWVAKVSARGGASFEFPGDGLAPIPVVFDVLSSGDPEEWVKVVGIELATEESSS